MAKAKSKKQKTVKVPGEDITVTGSVNENNPKTTVFNDEETKNI